VKNSESEIERLKKTASLYNSREEKESAKVLFHVLRISERTLEDGLKYDVADPVYDRVVTDYLYWLSSQTQIRTVPAEIGIEALADALGDPLPSKLDTIDLTAKERYFEDGKSVDIGMPRVVSSIIDLRSSLEAGKKAVTADERLFLSLKKGRIAEIRFRERTMCKVPKGQQRIFLKIRSDDYDYTYEYESDGSRQEHPYPNSIWTARELYIVAKECIIDVSISSAASASPDY
jgi:hypothetical protein